MVVAFIESPFTSRVDYERFLTLPAVAAAAALSEAVASAGGCDAFAPLCTGGDTAAVATPQGPAAAAAGEVCGGGDGGNGSEESGAARRPRGGPGLLDEPDFFKREQGAPLLSRNNGCLSPGGVPPALRSRLDRWLDLCGALSVARKEQRQPAAAAAGERPGEEALRIFRQDAERTFVDEGHRARMIRVLERVWPENRSYHQGLGFVCSLLMLFFDEDTVVAVLLALARDERYTPGYWCSAPQPYVRDAKVFGRLVQQRFPEVAARLHAAVVPEAYASKWFIGMCLHVLPFEALLAYVDAFLEQGYLFLFKFSLALVGELSEALLAPGNGAGEILAHLRLDPALYPDARGAFFAGLVTAARDSVELDRGAVDELRAEEWVRLQEHLRSVEAEMAAQCSDDKVVFSDESDDEGAR